MHRFGLFVARTKGANSRGQLVGLVLTAILVMASLGVLLGAIHWNLSIGEYASDHGTNGGNNAAWILFFASLAAFVTSTTTFLLLWDAASRRRKYSHLAS